MQEKYGKDFDRQIFEKYSAFFLGSDQFKEIRVSPQDGWGRFSPRDGIRLMGMLQTDPLGEQTVLMEEKITKQVVKGKNVTFFLDDQEVGKMSVITNEDQEINADAFLMDNPIYLQALLSRVTALVVEKYTPPAKDTVPA